MKYLYVLLVCSIYSLKKLEKNVEKNYVRITNQCIIQNCEESICGKNCFPSGGVACELNKGTTSNFFHFHAIKEEPNKILIKIYRGQYEEYVKCEVEKVKGENKIKKCRNTSRHRDFTLSQKILNKINAVIQDC